MRLVCTSDLHEHLPDVPACDLLVVAGDLTHLLGGAEDKREFVAGPFARWLEEVPAQEVVVVAGNHDLAIEQDGFPPGLRCHYLEDSGTEVGGLGVWGTPWQPWFHDLAFNAPRDDGERFLAERFERIPEGTDVLVCHTPPRGYGDTTPVGDVGSEALVTAIDRVRPRLVVCGHIHGGAGSYARGATQILNASLVDDRYAPAHAPVVVDL